MKLIETGFDGLVIVKHRVFKDERGVFIKTYNNHVFDELGIDLEIEERYFSISNKNVIRGMHFQIPPEDHVKLVTVISGQIIDVVLDLRINSKTYGEYFTLYIKGCDGITLYIPTGFAHGFKSLADNTIVEYNQTTGYSPKNDSGIHYNSFGYDWEADIPIISNRDLGFVDFENFKSPF